VITVTQTPAIGSVQNLGDVSVTLTATDECGNTSDCSFVVTISNSSVITWTNQATDMTIECDASILAFNTGLATASTTCGSGGLNVTYADVTAAGSCANASVITRTWTAVDACGNSISFDQIITIEDLIPPTIDCPDNDMQFAHNDHTLIDYSLGVSVNDNCSTEQNVIITQSPVAGTILTIGTHTITLTATDECGNASSCQFELEINSDLSIDSNKDIDFRVYPNPAIGLINLDFGIANDNKGSIQIYNIVGAIVYASANVHLNGVLELDLSSVERGVYYVSVNINGKAIIKKIILM